jgi:D-alanyl-lipoteichoic acid acyltransferase DltB (MBOAT superfamily)
VIIGFFKKLVIADRLALFVNQVYGAPENYDASILIIATFFFAFQIYCDFSGYTDIAIGVARMFGINLMENFKMPYLANGIKEFWSKWHISLSTWFRDYLYISLGGNRNRFFRNILIVFVVSGLWHGANWTFIIWGGLHGTYFLCEHFISRKFRIKKTLLQRSFSTAFTFLLVSFAWIFFRANNLDDAATIITNLTNFKLVYMKDLVYQMKTGVLEPTTLNNAFNLNYGEFYFQSTIGDLLLSFLLIPFLLAFEFLKNRKMKKLKSWPRAFGYFLMAISVLIFGIFSQNQFIYFQF